MRSRFPTIARCGRKCLQFNSFPEAAKIPLAFGVRNEYSFRMANATAKDRPSLRHIGGDKREAIMSAALELFVERGFYGTAVPEIAERAEVGAGTIYRYFE